MSALFISVVQVSVSTSLLLGILLLLLPLLRKNYAPHWRHAVWLLLAVRLLIPYNPTLPSPPVRIPTADPVIYTAPEPAAGTMPSPSGLPATAGDAPLPMPAASSGFSLTLQELLAWIWLAGVVALAVWQLASCLLFYSQVVRRSRREHSVLFEQLAAEYGLSGRVTLRRSARIKGPMAVGLLRPVILLPMRTYDAPVQELVLRHELTHCRRGDLGSKLLLAAARTLHWFNPLVWLLTRQAGRDIELCCDAAVLRTAGLEMRRCYADAMLEAMRQGGGVLLSTSFGGGMRQAKERFAAIFDRRVRRRGAAALGLVSICALAVGLLVACGSPELLTENQYERDGRIYTLEQLPQDSYQDAAARLLLCLIEQDWEGLAALDAQGGITEQARQRQTEGSLPQALTLLELRTLPAEPSQEELQAFPDGAARQMWEQLAQQELREGRLVSLRYRQTLPEETAESESWMLLLVAREGDAYRVFESGEWSAGIAPQTTPVPENPLPAYIQEMADKRFSLRSDAQANNSLTMERTDVGANIPGVPWHLAPALLEADLRPAREGEAGNLPVDYPFALHYADWEGNEDSYIFGNGYLVYQGANYVAENPDPLLEELAKEDFLSRPLVTLGEALGVEPQQVTGLSVTSLPAQTTQTWGEDEMIDAASALLGGWISPLSEGEQRNPETGGATVYELTVEGDMVYGLHDIGLLSLDGGETYGYIRVFIPLLPGQENGQS